MREDIYGDYSSGFGACKHKVEKLIERLVKDKKLKAKLLKELEWMDEE